MDYIVFCTCRTSDDGYTRGADTRHRRARRPSSSRHTTTTERPRARTSEDESRVRLPLQASGAFRERATAIATANDARDDDGRAVARDLAKTRRRARGGVEAMRARRRAREDVMDDDRERTSRLVREGAVVG